MNLKSQKYGTYPYPINYKVVESATLQQTDLTNNNNKFYQIELHEAQDKYRLYSAYGRTGVTCTKEERIPQSKQEALSAYNSLLKEKLKKYKKLDMVATSQGTDVGNAKILSSDVKNVSKTTPTTKQSSLDPTIVDIVTRIYSNAGQACSAQLSGAVKSTTKNPLGTLTLNQIKEGRELLDAVNDYLVTNPDLLETSHPTIVALTNQFYSAIPQVIATPPRNQIDRENWLKRYALNNSKILENKRELLDLLEDVNLLTAGFDTDDITIKYKEMSCKINVVPTTYTQRKEIIDYFTQSQSSVHSWRLKVKNLYSIEIDQQVKDDHISIIKSVGNDRLLFHGTRSQNLLGICKKGLITNPTNVVISGKMFGNGTYFADASTKSSQYAMGTYGVGGAKNTSYFMFVANVGLGNIKQYEYAQPKLQSPPEGYHSVQGVKGRSLVNNEYIIYNQRQHILNYLIEFESY